MKDTGGFKEIVRMGYEKFKHVLNLIEFDMPSEQIVSGNKVVNAQERLALTLLFLATGETRYTIVDMKVYQYLYLHINVIPRRFWIIITFTF